MLLGALVLLVILHLAADLACSRRCAPRSGATSSGWPSSSRASRPPAASFSEVANFIPCDLLLPALRDVPARRADLLAALFNAHWAARSSPVPVVGAAISVYHLLVENRVVEQTEACLVSAPGGCATKWIDEFGYMTIPTLALTAFALAFSFLLFAALDWRDEREPVATVPSDG